jgi:hypothetical protein
VLGAGLRLRRVFKSFDQRGKNFCLVAGDFGRPREQGLNVGGLIEPQELSGCSAGQPVRAALVEAESLRACRSSCRI